MRALGLKISMLFLIAFALGMDTVSAQSLEVDGQVSVTVEELPEYVVITSENTKLLGGINIIIDYKKSPYKASLQKLEETLQAGKKLRIRNQTDLLNIMSNLGFAYVDAYNAGAGTFGGGDDVVVSDSKFRINMIFRKKQ